MNAIFTLLFMLLENKLNYVFNTEEETSSGAIICLHI